MHPRHVKPALVSARSLVSTRPVHAPQRLLLARSSETRITGQELANQTKGPPRPWRLGAAEPQPSPSAVAHQGGSAPPAWRVSLVESFGGSASSTGEPTPAVPSPPGPRTHPAPNPEPSRDKRLTYEDLIGKLAIGAGLKPPDAGLYHPGVIDSVSDEGMTDMNHQRGKMAAAPLSEPFDPPEHRTYRLEQARQQEIRERRSRKEHYWDEPAP